MLKFFNLEVIKASNREALKAFSDDIFNENELKNYKIIGF